MDVPKEEWEEGDECTGCHKKFKLTRRKHHCRFCGKIFCDSCTNQREEGKRACWQCCAAKRSASPEFGDSINRGSLPRGSTGHIPSAIAGSSVPTSPSLGPHPGPRERIYSIPASEGGGATPYQLGTSYPQGASYQQVIMDPPPAEVSSPPVKKGKGADAAETARLKSSVVDLEAQVVTLNQELVKYQGFFTNACANLCKFEEARKQEDQEKEARGSLLSISRGEFAKQVSERKQLFSKGKHHSKACTVCQSEYSVTKREHHCRVCFNSVCNRCSLDTIKSQRACKWCVSRATLSSPDFFKSIGASPSCALTWVSCLDSASEKIWKTAAPGVAEAPFNQ